jgi:hypothetical protein
VYPFPFPTRDALEPLLVCFVHFCLRKSLGQNMSTSALSRFVNRTLSTQCNRAPVARQPRMARSRQVQSRLFAAPQWLNCANNRSYSTHLGSVHGPVDHHGLGVRMSFHALCPTKKLESTLVVASISLGISVAEQPVFFCFLLHYFPAAFPPDDFLRVRLVDNLWHHHFISSQGWKSCHDWRWTDDIGKYSRQIKDSQG